MAGLFVSWWYGEQFLNVLAYLKQFFAYIFDLFSVRICLSTLFSVWRRDRMSYEGLGIAQVLEAMTLNFASRLVGFIVKTVTILAWFVTSCAFLVFAFAFCLVWLFFPLVILALLYLGYRFFMWGTI